MHTCILRTSFAFQMMFSWSRIDHGRTEQPVEREGERERERERKNRSRLLTREMIHNVDVLFER